MLSFSVTHSSSQRLAMREELREEPGLVGRCRPSSRKYFSSVSFASRNATSLAGGALDRRGVDLVSPTIGRVLGRGRDVVRSRAPCCESSVKLRREPFAGTS